MNGRIIRTLAGKEIHHLWPLVFGLIALQVFGVVQLVMEQSLDEMSWFSLSFVYSAEMRSVSLIIYAIGVVGGYLMFAHERDEKTLQFLWTLPIPRIWIVLVKIGVAFAVLGLLIVVSQFTSWLLHLFAANTQLKAALTFEMWWRELLLLVGLQTIGILHGSLASNFRTAGVLVLVVIWTATSIIGYLVPTFGFLSLGNLMALEFVGEDVLVNSRAWLFHSVLALGAGALSVRLWTRRSDAFAESTRKGGLASKLMTVGACIAVFLVVVTFTASQILPPERFNRDARIPQLETRTVGRFEFSYYDADRDHAELVIRKMPTLYAAVTARLGENDAGSIVVNMTDTAEDHLGIAGFQRLRLQRSVLYDAGKRDRVFIHELAHVVAGRIADRRLSDWANETKFFNEGLAEWVTFESLDLESERLALHRLAAIAWQRHNLEFTDFLYFTSFDARFDQGLLYALGLTWVDSLVRVCSEAAPRALLVAMTSDDLSRRLSGIPFWQEVLGSINCDLLAVNRAQDEYLTRDEWGVDSVPIVEERISVAEDFVQFHVSIRGGEPTRDYPVTLKVRHDPSTPGHQVRPQSAEIRPGEVHEFRVPRSYFAKQTFQYQTGVDFEAGERGYFGRWIDYSL